MVEETLFEETETPGAVVEGMTPSLVRALEPSAVRVREGLIDTAPEALRPSPNFFSSRVWMARRARASGEAPHAQPHCAVSAHQHARTQMRRVFRARAFRNMGLECVFRVRAFRNTRLNPCFDRGVGARVNVERVFCARASSKHTFEPMFRPTRGGASQR